MNAREICVFEWKALENADEGIISDHGTVSLKKVQEAETQEGQWQGHFALYIKWHIYKLQYIKV